MTNKLKTIDFSEGIRQSEIQYNFDVIQKQIENERKTVGGPGISYGFECNIDNFNLEIKEGSLIAKDGAEVNIETTSINIVLPILIENVERLLEVDEYNRICLSEIPYAETRLTTADNVDVKDCGIQIVLSENNSISLSIANINNKYVTLNDYPDLQNKTVDVIYFTTYKRRDIVYLDSNYEIKYQYGITSPSPSIPEIDETELKYLLGYVQVDGHTVNEDGHVYASAEFIKDYSSIRNVYTSSDNKLYLCGIPFDSLKTIHFIEPTDPEEYCLWYDSFSNELKIWRHTDASEFADAITFTSSDPNHPQRFTTNVRYKYGQSQIKVYLNGTELIKGQEFEEGSDLTESEKENYTSWSKEFRILNKIEKGDRISYLITRYDGYAEWVAINSKSYTLAQERFIWTEQYLSYLKFVFDHDYQHFFFDSKENRNLLYAPNKNCLELLIDNTPLHDDQFEELTINDAIVGDNCSYIRQQLINNYNYKNDFENLKLAEEYENIGIGFKLGAALDKKSVIEARVTHMVNSNPISKRFQRSATFVAENSIIYEKFIKTEDGVVQNNQIFTCSSPYRYKENQLEVYLNGLKLDKDIDFIEYATEDDDKGCNLFKFKVLSELKDKDKISYKILSTVYSYDHVQNLLSDFKDEIESNKNKLEEYDNRIAKVEKDVKDYTEEIRSHMETISNIETNLDSKYLSKNAKINKDNLAKEIYEGIAINNINSILTITKDKEKINVTDVFSKNDFVIIIDINSNKLLCRDIDYTVVVEDSYCFLNIITSNVKPLDQICISGIRFNKS